MSDDQQAPMHTIGRLALVAGVTTQTIRLWEKRGRLASVRTGAGRRMFSEEMLQRAAGLAAESRRGEAHVQRMEHSSPETLELASTGARIRQARSARGLSQAAAADLLGISRSFLSAVERGASGVSTKILGRMADVFGIPMSGFAEARDQQMRVMRVSERPRTTLAHGVVWDELAAPNSHEIEPALLTVPAGAASGGVFVRPGEIFFLVKSGSLSFSSGEFLEEVLLEEGDSVVLEGGTPFSWQNDSRAATVLIWIELVRRSSSDRSD